MLFVVKDRLEDLKCNLRGGRAPWWERSPPPNVVRVQIPASTLYVGLVCCCFSPLLRGVFVRVLRFPPLKNQHFQISNFDQESARRRTTLWMCYLQFIIYLYLYIQLCWLCKKGCFTKVSQHFCPSLITGYCSFYTKSELLQVSQWLLMNLLAATSCVIFFCVAVKYSFIVLILSASNFWPVSQHKYVFITVF